MRIGVVGGVVASLWRERSQAGIFHPRQDSEELTRLGIVLWEKADLVVGLDLHP